MIWLIPLGAMGAFVAGVILAYAYLGQEEYIKRLRLEAKINNLESRDLPPRVLEVWINKQDVGRYGIYMGSIDADLAVEALALVGSGVRAFSEDGLSGVLSRREVARLRKECMSRNLCAWHPSGRSQGVVWTDDGKALLDQCRQEYARTHAHAPTTAKRRLRAGVGEGRSYA